MENDYERYNFWNLELEKFIQENSQQPSTENQKEPELVEHSE
jgi:hypothetical protein